MTISEKPSGIIREFIDNIILSGLPPDDDALELYQIKRLNLTIISLVLCVPLFATIYLYLGVPQIAVGTFVTGILTVVCFFLFRKTKNIILAANFILLIYAILIILSAVYLGGINSSSLWWNTHLPVLAVLLLNVRWAAFWTIIVISEMFLFIFLTLSDVLPASPLFGEALMFHDSATKIVAITLLFVFGVLFILERTKSIDILERTKENLSANALYQASLHEQLNQYAEELARLYRASGALVSSATTDLNSLSQAIVEVVLREFGQSNCSLLLVDPDTSDLIHAADAGPFAAEVSSVLLTLDGPGLVPLSISSGEIVNVPDVRANPDYVPNWEVASSEMVIPLKIGERVIGVIDVQSAETAAFNIDDERLMTAFAERAALALEHQRSTDNLQKFTRVVQQTADAVVITDLRGVIEYINPAFEILTGYTQAEAQGQTPRVVKSDLHDDAFYKKMWRTILQGKTFRGEMINRKKNGDLFHVNHTITPLKTPQGEISHFVSTWKDITERVQSEEARRESEERYRTVADFTYDWEYWIDPNGNYIYTSPSSERITGYRPQEFKQAPKLLESLIHPEDRVIFDQHFREHFTKNEILPIEFRIRTRAGEERWIEHVCLPVFGVEGQWMGRRATNRDITGRVQAEEGLAEANRVIRQERDIFVSGPVVVFKWQNQKGWPAEYVSPNVKDIIGYSVEEFISGELSYTEIIPEEDMERVSVEVTTHSESGTASYKHKPYRINRKDGKVIWVAGYTTILKEETGKITHYLGYIVDISERIQAENEMRRRAGRLEALHKVDVAISSSVDLEITLDILLEQAITQLNVDAATVLLYDPQTQILKFAAHHGFRTKALQHTCLDLGESHAGQAALDNKIIQILDMTTGQTGFLHSPLMRDEEFVSYLGVPLTAKGQIQGVLEIFHRSLLNPDSEWMELLKALSTQAAIAIDNAALFHDLQRSNVELIQAYDTTLEGWVKALELRDEETEGHTRRVTSLTKRLAKEMGISDEEMIQVYRGALLHDIGKMGIPDNILLKLGKLTEEEWEIMRQHPVYAYNFISQIEYLRPAIDIPYCHHEKWDGKGYPRGLKGEQIPLSARIFAVIDVWDALNSDRPYRKAWKKEKVIAYIQEQSGTHFDPQVVEVFLALVDSE